MFDRANEAIPFPAAGLTVAKTFPKGSDNAKRAALLSPKVAEAAMMREIRDNTVKNSKAQAAAKVSYQASAFFHADGAPRALGDEPAANPAKAALDRVAAMVALTLGAERKVEAAETELKRCKAELFKITYEDMPELLRESGFTEVTMDDGTKVAINDDISCAITEANAPTALKWLRDNALGSIIKTGVTVMFGKDELAKADTLFAQVLKKYGPEKADMSEKVHPATLKATLKERMEAGKATPAKLFSIQPYSYAKITPPKADKAGKSAKVVPAKVVR